MRRTVLFLLFLSTLSCARGLRAQESPSVPLVQITQSFDTNPGWEGLRNRIVGRNCPVVKQDFGWSPGRIGGTVWQSRTPAWYAMPMGRPLSFKDKFSFSGKIAVSPVEEDHVPGEAYIGFFNSTRQEWRPWNSMAIRLSYDSHNRATFILDSMTAHWQGTGYETDILIPADEKYHTFAFSYDPDASPPKEWPDPELKRYLSTQRRTASQIYEIAEQLEPTITMAELRGRLQKALALGLIAHFRRGRGNFYTLLDSYENKKGSLTIQIDDGQQYRDWLPAHHQAAPVSMDRFGIFNMQVYHRKTRFHLADLVVNGQPIDLSIDPHWQGLGNRTEFTERDFQKQDFGYSPTNWAGKSIGEIGGLFYRTEPIDPNHGYYADKVGRLTLDDPISFSGSICFTNGGTDAGMYFGYFNAQERLKQISDPGAGMPLNGMMGFTVDGPTRIGYYLTAHCSPTRALATSLHGPIFLPNRKRRKFSFNYDPTAHNNVGRITASLDDEKFTLDLTAAQRAAGAVFNRFGLANIRTGGKYVALYFDDLTYTALRAPGSSPVFHKQKTTVVDYPRGGRAH